MFMRNNLLCYAIKFLRDEDGQGITEYGAIIAFVATLVAVVFSFSQGHLAATVQTAFSGLAHNVNKMAAASS